MLSAVSGWPPMAYTSDNALAAAMRPERVRIVHQRRKKSVVCTSAKSSLSRKTPASSHVDVPTSRSGCVCGGS